MRDFMKPTLVRDIAPLLQEVVRLPAGAYQKIKNLTLEKLVVEAAKHHDKISIDAKGRPQVVRTRGQTSPTAELDVIVLRTLKRIASRRRSGEVVMADLVDKLGDEYSAQQIRRALARLQENGEITSQGKTKNKTYGLA